MKTQLLNDFLGSISLVNYIVAFMFVFLALSLKWIWKTIDSVKNNENTPNKFSWSYWFEHNLKPKILSLFSNIISVFIVLRFASELFGVKFSYVFALIVGLTLDYWIDKLKKIKPMLSKGEGDEIVPSEPPPGKK